MRPDIHQTTVDIVDILLVTNSCQVQRTSNETVEWEDGNTLPSVWKFRLIHTSILHWASKNCTQAGCVDRFNKKYLQQMSTILSTED